MIMNARSLYELVCSTMMWCKHRRITPINVSWIGIYLIWLVGTRKASRQIDKKIVNPTMSNIRLF